MLFVASHGAKILAAQAAREAGRDTELGLPIPDYATLSARGEAVRPHGVVPGCGGPIYADAYRKARAADRVDPADFLARWLPKEGHRPPSPHADSIEVARDLMETFVRYRSLCRLERAGVALYSHRRYRAAFWADYDRLAASIAAHGWPEV